MSTTIQVGRPDNLHHIELKGTVQEPEAIKRARMIILAQTRIDQTERGYLISCLDNGNYTIAVTGSTTTEATA
jgi:hypothetical protein